MRIISRAPVRIDFAGAWTDVKFFAHSFGGATCNAAIDRYVSGQTVIGGRTSQSGERTTDGIAVTYETDIPAGSGLGTSSALNVVWLSLAAGRAPQNREERGRIAEQAYEVETVLGILGGKQDQYAAAYGGFHLFEFEENEVRTHAIDIAPETVAELESRLVLCYTGQARLSSNLHEQVWGGFRAGKREVVDSLFRLRDSAWQAKDIFESANLDALGSLLNLQQECARGLSASLSNELVESFFDAVQGEIQGGKCCGAGGGGCMIFLCESPEKKHIAEAKLKARGAHLIPFKFTFEGLTVTHEND
jgi:D-glycero-alpha-D-manno-heptose-7-phosphate kinase